MGKEIERKFLVKGSTFKKLAKPEYYRQAYFNTNPDFTIRIRITDDKAFLTIKGKTYNATRLEYEYEIPIADAEEMIEKFCRKPQIEKNRYKINFKGFLWEVDEFLGKNKGLVIAEIELTDPAEKFAKPGWVGEEVTGNPDYYNVNL